MPCLQLSGTFLPSGSPVSSKIDAHLHFLQKGNCNNVDILDFKVSPKVYGPGPGQKLTEHITFALNFTTPWVGTGMILTAIRQGPMQMTAEGYVITPREAGVVKYTLPTVVSCGSLSAESGPAKSYIDVCVGGCSTVRFYPYVSIPFRLN